MPVTAANLPAFKQAALGARRGPAPLTSPTLAQLAAAAGKLYGSAIASDRMADLDYAKYVFHEIGQAVTENDFGPGVIQATQGTFVYTKPQSILTKCQAVGIPLVGHYLINAPDAPLSWMSALTSGTALAALQASIAGPVGHFAGQIDSYIVVNESIKPFGATLAGGYVQCIWTSTLGVGANGVPIYISAALTQARASDPTAKLILNFDQCETSTAFSVTNKAQIIACLQALQTANVPIDGIGMESHLSTTALTDLVLADNLAFLNTLQSMGLFVDITELDFDDSGQSNVQAVRDTQDAVVFAAYVGQMAAHPAVRSIRSWEISDRDSWLTRGNFGSQRADHLALRPSLLDGAYRIKPSYTAVAQAFIAAAATLPTTGPAAFPDIGVPFPSITFIDAIGQATIQGYDIHLSNWTPDEDPIGEQAEQLATGRAYMWPYRTDYTVTFEMGKIPAFYSALLGRLKAWLKQGGTCTVATEDNNDRTYTCAQKKGQKLSWKLDPVMLEYTLHCELLNAAPAPFVCVYSPSFGTGSA
jgi:endo-1,4-beta-xylanase